MKAHRVIISVAVAAIFSPAMAAAPSSGMPAAPSGNAGYVVDTRNTVVTSGAGQCWHTREWRPDLAVEPCDPVARKVVVAPVAAQPKPEQAPPPKQQAAPAPAPVPPPPKVVQQSVDLSTDALFAFDEAALQPEGRSTLDDLARQLSAVKVGSISVVGHADRIGDQEYNQKLSERRANSVKEYLASAASVPGDRIRVDAKGSTEPVTRPEDCRVRGEEAIACLAPDRRVNVEVTGTREVKEAPR